MPNPETKTETQTKTDGIEPRPIMFIGGPKNGKKIADIGQKVWRDSQGNEYRRVNMDAGDAQGRLSFDILAYWGKTWDQETVC